LEVPESALRVRYYHQDHLGSSGVITDAAGLLVEETAYLPFGGTRNTFRPRGVTEAYGFTQKEQDAETGLHYFEARFLASRFGRFTSADPLYTEPHRLSPEDFRAYLETPQRLNPYSYVWNHPLTHVDPSGQQGISLGIQLSGALLEVGGEVGIGLYYGKETGLSLYGSYGYGVALGLGVGGSVAYSQVMDLDDTKFFGDAYEYGINTPIVGGAVATTPDPNDPNDDAGIEGAYAPGISVGPSLGGDIHYFKTYTKELIGDATTPKLTAKPVVQQAVQKIQESVPKPEDPLDFYRIEEPAGGVCREDGSCAVE
jgi:RHS repeat-associated protein